MFFFGSPTTPPCCLTSNREGFRYVHFSVCPPHNIERPTSRRQVTLDTIYALFALWLHNSLLIIAFRCTTTLLHTLHRHNFLKTILAWFAGNRTHCLITLALLGTTRVSCTHFIGVFFVLLWRWLSITIFMFVASLAAGRLHMRSCNTALADMIRYQFA